MVADAVNPIQRALEHYLDGAAYQVMVRSSGVAHSEILRYYFKQPGLVRMEFIKPYNGAVLIYDPVRKLVRLWPNGAPLPAMVGPGHGLSGVNIQLRRNGPLDRGGRDG